MNQPALPKHSAKRLIASKPVFVSTIVLFILVALSIWLSGLGLHRSLYKNAIFTTSTLSFICFLFFSAALYQGWKLKDNLGKITHKFKWITTKDLPNLGFNGSGGDNSGDHYYSFLDGAVEGIGEALAEILFAILAFLLLLVFLWLFGNLLWAFISFSAAALYWIFFRAVRFVLRHRAKCRGVFWRSISYGFAYTLLYSCTFYLLILVPHFINRY